MTSYKLGDRGSVRVIRTRVTELSLANLTLASEGSTRAVSRRETECGTRESSESR